MFLNKNERYALLILSHTLIGLGIFYIHVFHTSVVFENVYNFRHLSKMEREMIFTSEHGLYFSYYKLLTEEPSFEDGFNKLLNDNLTEYPNIINAVHKFNIIPEVIIGFLYKQFMNVTGEMGIKTVSCWAIQHDNLEPVINCEGLGEPIYFYLEITWYLAGLTALLLYMYGTYLSRHFLGGLSVVVYYFIIHNDATRAHLMPSARENFAFPFILWQIFYITISIERYNTGIYCNKIGRFFQRNFMMIIKLTLLTTVPLILWQFSSFLFTTQTVIVFLLLHIGVIPNVFVFDYAISQIISNIISFYIRYENRFYLLSLHNTLSMSLLIYASKYILFPNIQENEQQMSRSRRFLHDTLFYFSTTFCVRDMIDRLNLLKKTEDFNAHYIDLILANLRIKPPTFNTILYAVNPLFSYIDILTLKSYNNVFVLKFFAVFVIIYLARWLQKRRREIDENPKEKIERAKNYLLEDFLEENRITLKDLSDPETDKKIKMQLEILKKFNYDYEKYKTDKIRLDNTTGIEKESFLSDIKKLKVQISENVKKHDNEKERKQQQQHRSITSIINDNNKISTETENNKIKVLKENIKKDFLKKNTNKENCDETARIANTKDGNKDKTKSPKNKINNKTTTTKNGGSDEPMQNKNKTKKSNSNINNSHNNNNNNNNHNNSSNKNPAEKFIRSFYLYNLIQTFFFIIMAGLCMKLKFILTPFLCLISSTFPPRNWFAKNSILYWTVCIILLFCSIADPGVQNLKTQYKHGEFSNTGLEELLKWIKLNTEQNAVFAAPMDISTSVLLTTRRPIVNHPHHELLEMEERTKLVYSIFSKKQSSDIYNNLAKLKVQYVILPHKECFLPTVTGWRMSDIWDFIEPENKNNPQFCVGLFQKPNPSFLKVFVNDKYLVIKIFSQSVELELKKINLIELNM